MYSTKKTPEWFGFKNIDFFLFLKIFFDYSVQTDVLKNISLVNPLSNQMMNILSYGLGVKVFWRYFHKGWLTESPT